MLHKNTRNTFSNTVSHIMNNNCNYNYNNTYIYIMNNYCKRGLNSIMITDHYYNRTIS